jgi:phosphoribosylformylglycinamidine synthase PurS subunit
MTSTARIIVTVKKDILDPAGEALRKALLRQCLIDATEVRVGKVIEVSLNDRHNIADQMAKITEAARHIFANPIMEDFSIEIIGGADGER